MSDPSTQPFIDLLKEVVVALEHTSSELRQLAEEQVRHEIHEEKMIAEVRKEIDSNSEAVNAELRRFTEQMTTLVTLWKTEQEDVRAAAARQEKAEQESGARREKALEALWSSTPIQLLLVGVVVSLLNLLGTSWVANSYLSTVEQPTPHSQIAAPPQGTTP
jgi:vacuolar-type H+-ATPase subunit I/STV1